jgi:hypothetical protein
MPFYKAAFEDVFHQAVKAYPFTKPLLRGFSSSCPSPLGWAGITTRRWRWNTQHFEAVFFLRVCWLHAIVSIHATALPYNEHNFLNWKKLLPCCTESVSSGLLQVCFVAHGMVCLCFWGLRLPCAVFAVSLRGAGGRRGRSGAMGFGWAVGLCGPGIRRRGPGGCWPGAG